MTESMAEQFVVCLNNDGYTASLQRGKLYRAVPDTAAASEGLIRLVDESGEDYAFESERFYPVILPAQVANALFTAK